MGGTAFKSTLGVESKRISTLEYSKLCSEIIPKLNSFFARVEPVRAYLTKESHGDLDILVCGPKSNNIEKDVKEAIGAQHSKFDGGTKSFLLNGFQIDLIYTTPEKWDIAQFYYNDSPSGNLLGKISHAFKLKLGQDGLYYRVYGEGVKLGTILISQDPRKICEFLDVDYDYKLRGFATEEDIFRWVVSSKYFTPSIFSYESMNHTARTRDRKRPDYRRFLQYIQGRSGSGTSAPKDLIPHIEQFFSIDISSQIAQFVERYNENKAIAEKFNGRLVMEWTNLKSKELGITLKAYKELKGEQFFKNNSAEDIKADFLFWIQNGDTPQ